MMKNYELRAPSGFASGGHVTRSSSKIVSKTHRFSCFRIFGPCVFGGPRAAETGAGKARWKGALECAGMRGVATNQKIKWPVRFGPGSVRDLGSIFHKAGEFYGRCGFAPLRLDAPADLVSWPVPPLKTKTTAAALVQ